MKEIEVNCETCVHCYLEHCLMGKEPNKLGKCKYYFKGVCRVSQKLLDKFFGEQPPEEIKN